MTPALVDRLRAAAGGWGLVAVERAADVGVTRLQMSRMADGGVLERIDRGIYRILTEPTLAAPQLKIAAAWMSIAGGAGSDVVVAGPAAAVWHGLLDHEPDVIDLVTATRRTTRRDDVRLRTRSLADDEVTVVDGIPIMTLERTLADLIELWASPELSAEAFARAEAAELVDEERLDHHLDPLARHHDLPDGSALRHQLTGGTPSIGEEANTMTDSTATRDQVDEAISRISVTALAYYPQVHADESEYDLAKEVAWCLEPLTELVDADRSDLELLVGEVIIDPTSYREQVYGRLLRLLPE